MPSINKIRADPSIAFEYVSLPSLSVSISLSVGLPTPSLTLFSDHLSGLLHREWQYSLELQKWLAVANVKDGEAGLAPGTPDVPQDRPLIKMDAKVLEKIFSYLDPVRYWRIRLQKGQARGLSHFVNFFLRGFLFFLIFFLVRLF